MKDAQALNAPVFKTLLETTENARSIARQEISELKKELTVLDRILSGRTKDNDYPLIDIPHSAFEIFRTASMVLENERMLTEMGDAVDRSLAEDFLLQQHAAALKEPEGWHWISPKGVMRYLGPVDDPIAAASKLKRYLPKSPQQSQPTPQPEKSESQKEVAPSNNEQD